MNLEDMHKLKADGKCPFCSKDMSNPEFKDEESLKEYNISGICQECQDEYFKFTNELCLGLLGN